MVLTRARTVFERITAEPEEPTPERELELDEVIRRMVAWGRQQDPVRWALAGITGVWAITFIALGWLRHVRFGTFGFDLGIYDQGVWLLSRFKDPFVTIRGLELFGHHVNLIRWRPSTGVNDDGRRFLRKKHNQLTKEDLHPCRNEYRPPSASAPRSTSCSHPSVTWPRSSKTSPA